MLANAPAFPLRRPFGYPDWAVLAAYAVVVLGIGFHYSRRQRTTEEYFVGGRRMNPILAGISVFAAYFSVLGYISSPGEYVQYGPLVMIVGPLMALPLVYWVVGWLLIPVVMRLPIRSAYELLEVRLGRPVRQAGSIAYIVSRLVWMSLILHVSSTILVNVAGCDPKWRELFTLTTGIVTITYTVLGGIRTVMVTEVFQSCVLFLGVILTVLLISVQVGGVAVWWPRHRESYWLPQPFFSLDPHVRASLVGTFVFYLIGNTCHMIIDQSAVQRLLTTRDAVAARRAFLLSCLATVAASLLLGLAGAALVAFFRLYPGAIPSHWTLAKNGDGFFPYYISHYLPRGISGIVVASLLAAAMSCFAGGLNSVTTVVSRDFIEVSEADRRRTEAAKLRITRAIVIFIGAAAILASIGMGGVPGNFVEIANKTSALLICPTFGLFFLSIFVKYATPFGAIVGVVYSATAAILVGYWDVITGLPGITFEWIAPISFVVSVVSSCLFSLLPTRRSTAALGGYSAAAMVPLVMTVGYVLRCRR